MTETVDEKIVFENIIKFDEFRHFCKNEWEPRQEKGASIDWLEFDPTIDQYAIQDYDATTGKPFVILQKAPETIDDAFLVAHEITHVIIDFDKQNLQIKINPVIIKKFRDDAIRDMSIRLGSMFDDPRVDSFLMHKYNFDPDHFYAKVKLPDAKRHLTPSSEGQFDLDKLNQAMFYSQTKLQCELVKNEEAGREWGELERLYHRYRPNVEIMGNELYSMSNDIGYDTLEKQKLLFQSIIGKNYMIGGGWKLGDALHIE